MQALKALGEYTHTHTHTQYLYQTVETVGNNVLANNAKAYLPYVNFNFLAIANEDGETM